MKAYITNISDWEPTQPLPQDLSNFYKFYPDKITKFEGTELEIYKQLFNENWIAHDSIFYLEKE